MQLQAFVPRAVCNSRTGRRARVTGRPGPPASDSSGGVHPGHGAPGLCPWADNALGAPPPDSRARS
eukprot:5066732-Lingulodinium_polyedra.AAC.1